MLGFVDPTDTRTDTAPNRKATLMLLVRIVISQTDATGAQKVIREFLVETESEKRPTASRIARLLARAVPGFRRRRGRYARRAGSEVLPAIELTSDGWRAWRLRTGDEQPSGFEPPIPGRVGKANSRDNPFADRTRGYWERADIIEVKNQPALRSMSSGGR